MRGAGKTLLSSIFQQLLVPTPRTAFYLEIPDDEGAKRVSLTNTFLALADPDQNWPPGTRGVEDWSFTCVVRSGTKTYPVFQIQYLDFAGGILTGADEGYREVQSRVREADAILVLIDGHRVLDLMRNQSQEIYNHFRFMLPLLNHAVTRTVHFVISKWDLLEDEYSLEAVRERLLENEHFQGTIAQRSPLDTPTRLIPVSAIGKGVARVGDNGQMEKIPGAFINPKYVEMPLACTLVDAFEAVQQEIKRNGSRLSSRAKRASAHLLKFLGLSGLAAAMFLGPQMLLGKIVITMLFEFFSIGMTRIIRSVEMERIVSGKTLKDSDQAIATALLSCNSLMMELEREEPYSNFRTSRN